MGDAFQDAPNFQGGMSKATTMTSVNPVAGFEREGDMYWALKD